MTSRIVSLGWMVVWAAMAPVWAQTDGGAENMLGRQAHNVGLRAVPAPAAGVEIDGDLGDWDLSGQNWSFADIDVRDRFSARTAAMWDKKYLYVAVDWRDPTPMHSMVNPLTDPGDGWKGDSLQMRVVTDKPLWVTIWHYTPEARSVLQLAYWHHPTGHRHGMTERMLIGEPGAIDLGDGVQMAFRKHKEGHGYVQEMRIPWKILYHDDVPEIAAGHTIRSGFEFLWGDPTGRTWPIHRYADNLQAGWTMREFFWVATPAWGDVTLEAAGNLDPRRYIAAGTQLEGPLPIRAEVPASASRFTLVIEDMAGRRIRNLAADQSPLDYSVSVADERRTIEVPWDGLDDEGRFVGEGSYRVRGLTHQGLGAEYEMTFYNPGTPPWDTQDGAGSWGADHGAPEHVAAAGDWVIAAWAFAEGGSGIIGIDPQGRKRWGEKRGARALAAAGEHLYAIAQGWHTSGTLVRMGVKDGSYHPFILDGEARPFELPLADAINVASLDRPDSREAYEQALAATRGEPLAVGAARAMAADGNTLAIALTDGRLALLDPASARLRRLLALPGVVDIAFGADGMLFALLDDARVVKVDAATGAVEPLPIEGLDRPTALAVDREGRIVIADMGAPTQVRAFAVDGTLAYTAGREGGRPIRGTFDPEAMMRVSSVAVDSKGQIWTTENWNYPRRVSVWSPETGKLVRDYIGNTQYAAGGTYLHDQNPELAYEGAVEMRLDRETRSWTVSRVLWVPGEGEHFPVAPSAENPHRFRSNASGQVREYMFHCSVKHAPWVLYMEMDSGAWQPVFAMGLVGVLTGNRLAEDAGDFSDLSAHNGFIWNDHNNDGRVQRAELEIASVPTDSGWGNRMHSDTLEFYATGSAGVFRIRPSGFRDNGAPIYTREGIEPLGHGRLGGQQDLVPASKANVLLDIATLHCGPNVRGLRGIDLDTKDILWTYPNPYPGVHASHTATMPAPGLLIGALKITGVAHVNDAVGEVFGVRGNLGQDFFFTADGLAIGAMFPDARLPGETLPDSEAKLAGMPMETFSQSGEPFNGWMGRQDDGAIRLVNSIVRNAGTVIRLTGFDAIRRFDAGTLDVDAAAIIAAEQYAAELAAAAAEADERVYSVIRRPRELTIDGNLDDWKGVKPLAIRSPASPHTGRAWMAYDDAHLYVAWEIQDPNPWRNTGRDVRRLFKTGDIVDLHLGVDPNANPERGEPAAGDVRLLVAPFEGKPVAVLMRPVDPDAPRESAHAYTSPVGTRRFDRVQMREDIRTAVTVDGTTHRVEAAIPLALLGLEPAPGLALRGDIGFVTSNAAGTENSARTYWANPFTNLINDEPAEAWLHPKEWGKFVFE